MNPSARELIDQERETLIMKLGLHLTGDMAIASVI